MTTDEEVQQPQAPLHILDLPHLRTRPSYSTLLSILQRFALAPPSWSSKPSSAPSPTPPEGFTRYLTSIIASPLSWVSESEADALRDLAATRISERCGRSAQGDIKRSFRVPVYHPPPPPPKGAVERFGMVTPPDSGISTPVSGLTAGGDEEKEEEVEILLHEPALTADNLGLKTWGSSYLLARRLGWMKRVGLVPGKICGSLLELGAGTGLVGLAAAAAGVVERDGVVRVTDLPEIVPNLSRNLEENRNMLKDSGVTVEAAVLDWTSEEQIVVEKGKWLWVVAADPLYSPEHPRLLVGVVGEVMARRREARCVVEMPLRVGYEGERADFRDRMQGIGLEVVEEGEEEGRDDWGGPGGEEGKVRCWWSVWGWKEEGIIETCDRDL